MLDLLAWWTESLRLRGHNPLEPVAGISNRPASRTDEAGPGSIDRVAKVGPRAWRNPPGVPTIVFLAGPNGAGKTTSAPRLLRHEFEVVEYVNADVIASGISAFNPESAALEAGRVLLARTRALAARRVSFSVETTLSGRAYAPWLKRLISSGYEFSLLFLSLPSEEMAVARVAQRVKLGGHDIPEGVVRRRFKAGLRHFFELYQPIAGRWCFYDNAGDAPRPLAHGSRLTVQCVLDERSWGGILRAWSR
ncbi:hypothetical protein DYH09_09095 [bacterium CPR1]|nr:hypothetical protein [bacterium CPR1]